MKVAVVVLVLVLAGCSSSPSSESSPPEPERTWIGMLPGDALPFDGPGGELVLIYVDETYTITDVNASALTWALGEEYTTDYFVEDDDGTIWWYGRRGDWRVGRHGEEPREVGVVDHRVTFGDRSITLSDDDGPLQLTTSAGTYRR